MRLRTALLLVAAVSAAVTSKAAGQASPAGKRPAYLPRKGLVAFWSADGHAKDSLGKHHGTTHGSMTFTTGRRGKAKGAFGFNGKSGFVTIPDSAPLDTDDAFTLAAWINPSAYTDQHRNSLTIFAKWYHSETHGDYIFYVNPDGRLCLYVCAGPRVYKPHYGKSVVPKNTWTHVAATFDAGTIKLYINGRLDVTKVSTKVRRLDPAEYKTDDLHIGAHYNNANNFNGAIDDVGIWNRALSAEEIQSVFKMHSLEQALRWAVPGVPGVTRKADADRVVLKDDNILLGTIENKTYTVATFFGKLEIPAKDVVGLVGADKRTALPRLILTDEQVVAGKLTGQSVQLTLPGTGSTLQVPVERIRELGYRISKEKPAAAVSPGAMVALRNGNRLAWTEMKHKLQLVTSYATVDLPTGGIRTIDVGGKTVRDRRVQLANGSTLTGTLLPNRLKLKLQLGPVAELHDAQVVGLTGPAKPAVPAGGATMVMRNGDRLLGRVTNKTLTIRTSVGDAKVRTTSISVVEFDPKKPDAITVRTWGGGVMTGRLVGPTVAFAIAPGGPTVKAKAAQIASITRSVAEPPPKVLKKIEKLVAQLGAESYVDREKAQKELIAMGKSIVPLLKKYLAETRDPEIRQRLEEIIKTLGG